MRKILINLDLHGGDFAPNSVLEGANIAYKNNNSIQFQFHSTKEVYEKYIKKFSQLFESSIWIESENFILPEMKPSDALKKNNRKSSMSNAINQLKEDKSPHCQLAWNLQWDKVLKHINLSLSKVQTLIHSGSTQTKSYPGHRLFQI